MVRENVVYTTYGSPWGPKCGVRVILAERERERDQETNKLQTSKSMTSADEHRPPARRGQVKAAIASSLVRSFTNAVNPSFMPRRSNADTPSSLSMSGGNLSSSSTASSSR
ncbi:hypothetical protein KP509_07G051900 [Ceratopteris richardii]|uniref:Uncharacterized protein n=1 Tax=Ceratopteris richardii TaxID=49495 RepID=A0A8T2UI85_CERRI|nr:hypothetical protein KP509_07G051900 [Ceratopteris richardii]